MSVALYVATGIKLPVDKRLDRVADLITSGHSIRATARLTGVSKSQILRDLERLNHQQ